MKVSSPWVNFYRELEALFAEDDEVKVVLDEENVKIKMYVENSRKADALSKLIPSEKVFGNVTLTIDVVPANDGELSKAELIQEAFCGNPALSFVWSADTAIGHFNYVVFKNKVVQYFNDDLSDINGNRSTLYQEIAKDVFGSDPGTFYCTEAGASKLNKPLGEWP